MRGSNYNKQDSDTLFEAYKNLDEIATTKVTNSRGDTGCFANSSRDPNAPLRGTKIDCKTGEPIQDEEQEDNRKRNNPPYMLTAADDGFDEGDARPDGNTLKILDMYIQVCQERGGGLITIDDFIEDIENTIGWGEVTAEEDPT
jgi:hypothetical protein